MDLHFKWSIFMYLLPYYAFNLDVIKMVFLWKYSVVFNHTQSWRANVLQTSWPIGRDWANEKKHTVASLCHRMGKQMLWSQYGTFTLNKVCQSQWATKQQKSQCICMYVSAGCFHIIKTTKSGHHVLVEFLIHSILANGPNGKYIIAVVWLVTAQSYQNCVFCQGVVSSCLKWKA